MSDQQDILDAALEAILEIVSEGELDPDTGGISIETEQAVQSIIDGVNGQ